MPPAAMQNQFPDREVLSQPLLTETTNHITGSLTAEPNCGHWRAVKQNQFLDREQLSQSRYSRSRSIILLDSAALVDRHVDCGPLSVSFLFCASVIPTVKLA